MRLRTHLFAAVAGAALIALAGCNQQDTAAASGTTTSPVAAHQAATGVKPSASRPKASACPVSATTLQKVSGLSAGYKIKSSSIECASGWATAEVTAPSAAQQGDGVIVFAHSATSGRWQKKTEASSLDCGAIGIPARAAAKLSVCEPRQSPASGAGGCPVSAATLQKAAALSTGYRIQAASIRCEQGWATATVTAPTAAQQGDGVVLFKYATTTLTWQKKGEGSSLDCAMYGIPKSTGFCSVQK